MVAIAKRKGFGREMNSNSFCRSVIYHTICPITLIVVFAAPLACFMMLKDNTLCGSPSSSMVIPFLISEVSTATARAEDCRGANAMGAKAEEPEAKSNKLAKLKSFIMPILFLRK